ncbi:RiPP maturation radical SAM C-methyltransferase [Actinokineospora enzanensis]|uniref:RiPP maturation radical SAM C-methyltransferase n=1 Tax=Actinokineospora enzanensis TaxID=155975 RepID=UPI000364B9F0|nr:RiPP maturation radical SAM C-methyltransferase [Actinokineospora enzanensis]
MSAPSESKRDFIITALPWQRYDTTAIQLGALQAWLDGRGFSVDTRHFYKDLISYMSPSVYMRLFEAYMGESAFAALMFPERHERIAKAVVSAVDFDLSVGQSQGVLKHPQLNANLSMAEREQLAKGATRVVAAGQAPLDFDALVRALATFLDDVFDAVPWQQYKVIGFTTSHQQLIPTVLLSRRIKAAFPEIPIVIGGALMTMDMPRTVLRLFECFDVVVEGEGEETATELLSVLTGREPGRGLADVRGITWRRPGETGDQAIVRNLPRPAMHDLDELPPPDYTDYFRHQLRPDTLDVIPKLTLEASRACVWGKCTYCNLNLQWRNVYRRKSHLRVAQELAELRKRYRSPYVTFCDTNVEDKIPLFDELARDEHDYRILVEVSPNITRDGVRSLRDGGVRTIQAGIESFSERILRLYQRNHRLMRSLELLKWTAEFDVETYYNIIINFPAEEQADVDRCVAAVDYARYFMYPSVHDYSFTIDSPAWNDMAAYNISGWYVPDEVSEVYPDEYATDLAQLLALTIKPVPARDPGVDWGPFLAEVDGWKRRYHANLGRPGLVYVDGGDFLNLTIRAGGQGNDVVMQLPDEYRDIYLACGHSSRTLDEIAAAVPSVPRAEIADILHELHDLRVLYAERNRYLALAIRERNIGNYPHQEPARRASSIELPLVAKESPESRTKRIVHHPADGRA